MNLTDIRKELNSRIDAIEFKYEESLKPKFEVGKWNWLEFFNHGAQNRWLFFITTITPHGTIIGYGFECPSYRWHDLNKGHKILGSVENISKQWLATDQEVLEALTKEAKKRGLVEGAKYKTLYMIEDDHKTHIVGDEYKYNESGNCLYNGFQYLFIKGQWATPIPKEKTSDEWAREYDNQDDLNLPDFIKNNNLKIVKDETNS